MWLTALTNFCWCCSWLMYLALVVFSFHQLSQILHLHTRWSAPAATCTDVVFPTISWCKYSTCTRGGQHLLQLVLVFSFQPQAPIYTPSSLVWSGIPSDVSWFEACCARQGHRCMPVPNQWAAKNLGHARRAIINGAYVLTRVLHWSV